MGSASDVAPDPTRTHRLVRLAHPTYPEFSFDIALQRQPLASMMLPRPHDGHGRKNLCGPVAPCAHRPTSNGPIFAAASGTSRTARPPSAT